MAIYNAIMAFTNWMWVIGFVAMALKYSEALLGVYTREKDANGQWRGGANIYLAKIWKPLGWIWAITCCFGMAIGCGVHTGAISSSVHTFGVPSLITTVVWRSWRTCKGH